MPRPIARIYAPLADYFAAHGATGGRIPRRMSLDTYGHYLRDAVLS